MKRPHRGQLLMLYLALLWGSLLGGLGAAATVFDVQDYASLNAAAEKINASCNATGGMQVHGNYTVRFTAGTIVLPAAVEFTMSPLCGGWLMLEGAKSGGKTVLDCSATAPAALLFLSWGSNISVADIEFLACLEGAVQLGGSAINTTATNSASNVIATDTSQAVAVLNLVLQVVVERCRFSSNVEGAVMSNGATAWTGAGGVSIGNASVSLDIRSSEFSTNSFNLSSGEQCSLATIVAHSIEQLQISNCTFYDNTNPCCILAADNISLVVLEDSSFSGNYFPPNATLSLMTIQTLEISRCTFDNNSGPAAEYPAGVILAGNVDQFSIDHSSFTNLDNGEGNGATAVGFIHSGTLLRITNSIFQNCSTSGNGAVGGMILDSYQIIDIVNCSFRNVGSNGYRSIGALDFLTTIDGQVTIHNSKFVNCSCPGVSGNGVLSISGPSPSQAFLNISGCRFDNNYAEGDFGVGGMSISDLGSVNLENCSFTNNSNPGGGYARGAIYVGDLMSNLTVSDCTFINNTANGYYSIGGIYTINTASVLVERSVFIGNVGEGDLSKGAIRLSHVTEALIEHCRFESNTCSCSPDNTRDPHLAVGQVSGSFNQLVCGGPAVFVFDTSLTVVSSEFAQNQATTLWGYGGAVLIYSAHMHAINCSFVGNVAAVGGAISALAGSYLSIDAPVFLNQSCNNELESVELKAAWPDLFVRRLGKVVPGSLFDGNMAVSGGGCMILDSALSMSFFGASKCTLLNASTVVFKNNRAMTGGAVSSFRSSGDFCLVHAEFVNNSAIPNEVESELIDLLMGGTGNQSASAETSASLQSVASSAGCASGNGGAVCWLTTGLSRGISQAVAASHFKANRALYGGALYVTSDVLQCTYPDTCNTLYVTGLRYCGYVPGGKKTLALSLYAPGDGNTMLEDSEVSLVDNVASRGAGGGLFLETTQTISVQCNDLQSVSFNFGFSQNIACIEDAKRNVSEPYLRHCSSWLGNMAVDGAFGDLWASSPTSVTVTPLVPEQLLHFTSGGSLALQVQLFDLFDQEYVVDVVAAGSGSTTLIEVAATREVERLNSINIVAGANEGTLPQNKSTIRLQSTPGTVQLVVSASLTKFRRVLPVPNISLVVRPCHLGERTAADGKLCLWCEVGQTNLNGSDDLCDTCPDSATCITDTDSPESVNAVIAPNGRYYNSNPFSAQMWECLNYHACLYDGRAEAIRDYQNSIIRLNPFLPDSIAAFNQSYYNDLLCAPGYTGPGCGSCTPGYGAVGSSGRCIECVGSLALSGFKIFVANMILIIPLLWTMAAQMSFAKRCYSMGKIRLLEPPGMVRERMHSSMMKVIVSYIQILGMLLWVKFSSSATENLSVDALSNFRSALSKAVYAGDNFASLSCTTNHGSAQRNRINGMVVSFSIPIAGYTLLVIIWGSKRLWRLLRPEQASPDGVGGLSRTHSQMTWNFAGRSSFFKRLLAENPPSEASNGSRHSKLSGFGCGSLRRALSSKRFAPSSSPRTPLPPDNSAMVADPTRPPGLMSSGSLGLAAYPSETNMSAYPVGAAVTGLTLTPTGSPRASPSGAKPSCAYSPRAVPQFSNLSINPSINRVYTDNPLKESSGNTIGSVGGGTRSNQGGLGMLYLRKAHSSERFAKGSFPGTPPPPLQMDDSTAVPDPSCPPGPISGGSLGLAASTSDINMSAYPGSIAATGSTLTHEGSPRASPSGARTHIYSPRAVPQRSILSINTSRASWNGAARAASLNEAPRASGAAAAAADSPAAATLGVQRNGLGDARDASDGDSLPRLTALNHAGAEVEPSEAWYTIKVDVSPDASVDSVGCMVNPLFDPANDRLSPPATPFPPAPPPPPPAVPLSLPPASSSSSPPSRSPSPGTFSHTAHAHPQAGVSVHSSPPTSHADGQVASNNGTGLLFTPRGTCIPQLAPLSEASMKVDQDNETSSIQQSPVGLPLVPGDEGAKIDFTEACEEEFSYAPVNAPRQMRGRVQFGRGSIGTERRITLSTVAVIAFTVTTFFFYPSILQQTCIIFLCYIIDDHGQASGLALDYGLYTGRRWIQDFETVCYQGDHIYLVIILGIPGILFCIGFPLFSAWWLTKKRSQLNISHFNATYNFMYEDYKAKYYAWESVDMLRKICLSTTFIFLSDSRLPPGTQLVTALSISVFFLLLHLHCAPHKSERICWLESLSQVTILITILYCFYFTYPDMPRGFSAFTLAIGIINIVVFSFLVLSWLHIAIDGIMIKLELSSEELHTMKLVDITPKLKMGAKDCGGEPSLVVKCVRVCVAGLILGTYKFIFVWKALCSLQCVKKLFNSVHRWVFPEGSC